MYYESKLNLAKISFLWLLPNKRYQGKPDNCLQIFHGNKDKCNFCFDDIVYIRSLNFMAFIKLELFTTMS